jgi:hypothetical protein
VWWCQQQQLLLCCESLSGLREAPKCLALKLQTCAIYPWAAGVPHEPS